MSALRQQVDGAAAASEKTAEDLVEGTKELRAQAAAMMEEAKLASAAYQAALAAGQTDGLAELEAKAKQVHTLSTVGHASPHANIQRHQISD